MRVIPMFTTRKSVIALGVAVAVALGAVAILVANAASGARHGTNVALNASWAKGYTTIAGLKADSDVAVNGTVGRIAAVTKDSQGLVFSDFAINIKQVLYDPHHLVGSSEIVIHQTGGIIGSTRYEIGDDPLFQVGEHIIVFLHRYSQDHYYVLGGPTGRFRVQGGLVHPVSPDGVRLTSPITESDFAAKVSAE